MDLPSSRNIYFEEQIFLRAALISCVYRASDLFREFGFVRNGFPREVYSHNAFRTSYALLVVV